MPRLCWNHEQGSKLYVTYELLRDNRREQGVDQGFPKAKEQKEAIAT